MLLRFFSNSPFGRLFVQPTFQSSQAAVSFDYKGKVDPHASQKDYAVGFGGKYGVQTDRKDKSAAGWDERVELSKHESQKGRGLGIWFSTWYLTPSAFILSCRVLEFHSVLLQMRLLGMVVVSVYKLIERTSLLLDGTRKWSYQSTKVKEVSVVLHLYGFLFF